MKRDKSSSSNRINMKPQDRFRIPVDNSLHPFVSRITSKPNALEPLDVSQAFSKRGIAKSGWHPYETEIDALSFPEGKIKKCEPQKWRPLNETPLQFVGTIGQLKTLLTKLKLCTEIAVDLEGHTRRSFLVRHRSL